MSYSQLKRNAGAILPYLKEVDDTLITGKDIKIIIPYRYLQGKLATVGSHISVLGVFAISDGVNFAVSNVCSTMSLTPDSTNIVTFEGEDFFELEFSKGSVVCPNLNLVVDDKNAYNVYNEFIAKGKVPWFLSYEDFGKVLMTAHTYAGINLAGNNAPLELIITSIARNPKDLYKYYRNEINSLNEILTKPPAYVPFKSVAYGATNTTGKIMGSYFDEGLTSALTVPESGPQGVEVFLRQ